MLARIDARRRAAGWADDEPPSAFGLLRLAGAAAGGDVWLDARRALGAYALADHETLEYRTVQRSVTLVRLDADCSEQRVVSQRLVRAACARFYFYFCFASSPQLLFFATITVLRHNY